MPILLAALVAASTAPTSVIDGALEPRWKLAWADLAHYSVFDFANGPARASHERPVGLFGYEIENGRTFHPRLGDWREIPLVLGFTLPSKLLEPGKKVALEMQLDRGFDYGTIVARGYAKRVGDTKLAAWTLHFDLAPASTDGRAWQSRFDGGTYDATVELDEARGLVTRLEFELALARPGLGRDGEPRTESLHEELSLDAVHPADDAALGEKVDRALARGTSWLWEHRETDGTWGSELGPLGQHPSGRTALAMLAILKGTVERSDLRARAAIDWLLAQPRELVYDTSLAMLALEAWYAPSDPTRGARGEAAPLADVSDAHRAWMRASVDWLAANADEGWWAYPGGEQDMSNTQFAVLGLLAGSRFGVGAPDELLTAVVQRYLANQARKGTPVRLALALSSDNGKTAQEIAAEARGWTYRVTEDVRPYYPTVTAAGVASLTILDALLGGRRNAVHPPALRVAVKSAVRDGWAWLADGWNVRRDGAWQWDTLWLYTLMRAGVLTDVAIVGKHDWYREGARWLLATQEPDGGWQMSRSRVVDTAFAVLFLRRATIRVATRSQ